VIDDLEAPTWRRKGGEESEPVPLEKAAVQFSKEDDDRFDIPTFLRRQMD
jgi:hypothetical protein